MAIIDRYDRCIVGYEISSQSRAEERLAAFASHVIPRLVNLPKRTSASMSKSSLRLAHLFILQASPPSLLNHINVIIW
jgi:hypothetical protein